MRVGRRVIDALRSPRRLGAFAARIVRLTLRGELAAVLRRLHPRGFTPDEYREWASRRPSLPAQVQETFIIAVDVDGGIASREVAQSMQRRTGPTAMIVARSGGGWSASDEKPAQSLDRWVAAQRATWILWIGAPLELADDALPALVAGCAMPGARVVYADHLVVDEHGTGHPVFASAWDRIRIGEQPYAAPVLAIHAELAHVVDRSAGGVAGQWRFLIDAVASIDESRIVHVPHVVARLAAREDPSANAQRAGAVAQDLRHLAASQGVSVAIDTHRQPVVTYRTAHADPVSIVIPTRDRPDLVERCVDSILQGGWPANGEILVVDNGSTDARLPQLLRALSRRVALRVIRRDIPFNFPLLCNAGVEASRGRVAVLLNNDTEVRPGWLDELVPLAVRSDVGAVGPLVLYPDGVIQSAGVLVGINRTATSALEGFDARSPVARTWCASRRRVSAVLGACIAIERDKYLRIGGMDPSFTVSHNEVDFCLRVQASGLANVFTPFARIVHAEGATRGFEVTAAERARLDAEEKLFLARWKHVLDQGDPAHHPAYARSGNPFLLGTPPASALRPRAGWGGVASAGSARRDAAPG